MFLALEAPIGRSITVEGRTGAEEGSRYVEVRSRWMGSDHCV